MREGRLGQGRAGQGRAGQGRDERNNGVWSLLWCAAGQGNEWCECDAARPDPAWGLLIALNFS